MKVCLIWSNHYNDKLAETHHTFFEAALKDMGIEFARYSWNDWQIHMKPIYDLYFFIDFHPSLYQLHKYPQFHPRCFYFWDCFHHSFVYPAQVIENFDRSYFAELNTVTALKNMGCENIEWLPGAAYEGIYKPLIVDSKYTFSFVGQPDHTVVRKGKTRKEFFTELSQIYINSIVTQGIYGNEVNKIYNQSKILIDRTIFSNLGTRFFELLASGGFVLVNRGKINSGIDKIAINNVHYVSYDDSVEDCMRKIDYYLIHEEERNKIANAGYNHFLKNHTYKHRLETIFRDFGL